MSTTTDERETTLVYPSSIRQYLDEGGELGALPSSLLYWLAECLFDGDQIKVPDPSKTLHVIATAPATASSDALLSFATTALEEELLARWGDEMSGDAKLGQRVAAAMPEWLREKFKVDREVECEGKAYSATRTVPDGGYRCAITGELRTGPAIEIRLRGYLNELPEVRDLPPMLFSPEAIAEILAVKHTK